MSFGIHDASTSALSIKDSSDANTLFYVNYDGEVGIGTTNPQSLLSVASAETQIFEVAPDTGNDRVKIFAYDRTNSHYVDMFFGDDKLILDSSGNVGIGTQSPANDVSGLHIAVASSTDQLYLERTGSGTGRWWLGTASDSLYFQDDVANATRMIIDSSGNVGIGTTSPASHYEKVLHIHESSGSSAVHLTNNTTGSTLNDGCDIIAYEDDFYIRNRETAGKLFLGTNAGTDMTIDSSGNVGIGTDDPSQAMLVINQTTAGGRNLEIINTDSQINASDELVRIRCPNDGDLSGGYLISFEDSTDRVGSITGATGTSIAFNTTSDYRLKENEVPISDGLQRLNQLKPYRFNWKKTPDIVVDGFFAHEVQDIVAEAVIGEKDAMKEKEYEVSPAEYDEDGNITKEAVMGTREVPDYQGIDQSKLVPLLVAAVQELSAKVEALENA